MAARRFTPTSLYEGMVKALPDRPGDDGGKPDIPSAYEAIALAIHAYLVSLNFRFAGFDEHKATAGEEGGLPLPSEWTDRPGSQRFAYRHKQSAMTFVIHIDRMGFVVEVRGLAVGDEKIYRFDTRMADVVHGDQFPVSIPRTEDGNVDRAGVLEILKKVFVSPEAVYNLLKGARHNIVNKLIPGLQVEDDIEEADAEEQAREERRTQEAAGRRGPHAQSSPAPARPFEPQGPLPAMARPRPPPTGDIPRPDFEDEHQMQGYPSATQPFFGGRSPYNIGHDDLNPPGLGPHDPFRPSFTGGGVPLPGRPSGMHPTFDDPLFAGQGRRGPEPPPGQGYDPQAPPGARWDPVGPGGGPRFPGPGSGGNFGGFGPGGGGGFGGFGPGGGGGII